MSLGSPGIAKRQRHPAVALKAVIYKCQPQFLGSLGKFLYNCRDGEVHDHSSNLLLHSYEVGCETSSQFNPLSLSFG